MYIEGTFIGLTSEGYGIYCEYDKYCKAFVFTAAEFDGDEMVGVYGLHINDQGELFFQSGRRVEVMPRGRVYAAA